jgi:hypothetical protein
LNESRHHAFALSSRQVAATPLNLEPHAQLTALGQMSDDMARIDNLDRMASYDIAGHDRTRPFWSGSGGFFCPFLQADSYPLKIEQDINDIFLHTLNSGILMQNLLDFTLDDSSPGIDESKIRRKALPSV